MKKKGDVGKRTRADRIRILQQSFDRMVGVPSKKQVQLRYCDYSTMTSTLGAITTAEYSCNGLFDPRVAIGGHQPMGFDQWIGQYYNYAVVVGSTCTVRFMMESASTAVPVACGVFPYDATNDSMSVQGYTVWTAFKEAGIPITTLSTLQPGAVATCDYDQVKLTGLSIHGSPTFYNTVGANPSGINWHFYVWLQNVDYAAADTSVSVIAMVEITYDVEFFDRIPLAPS